MQGYVVHQNVYKETTDIIDYIFKVSSFDKLDDFADAFDALAGLAAENPKMAPRDESMAFPDISNTTLPQPYNNYVMYWVIRDQDILIFHLHHVKQEKPTHTKLVQRINA